MQSPNPRLVSSPQWSCDVEPIHIPGSVQPHGLLLLFDATSEKLAHWAGDCEKLLGTELTIGQRAKSILGASLKDLIGLRALITDEEAVHIGSVNAAGMPALSIVASRTGCFIAIELEPAENAASTAAALEHVRAVSDRISAMPTLADAFEVAAAHVRKITGYDRVMVYEFLPDGSGSVVAEARAPDMGAFMNHRFPGSDIPAQARELYLRNLIRVIPDISYRPAPLQPACNGLQIDMSHCVLRSLSPAHLVYLKNMGVGASMSISLVVDGKLWGLIACHHRSARNVSVEERLLCRHVGISLSAFISGFGHTQNAARALLCAAVLEESIKSLSAAGDPERALRSSAEQLAQMVDCSGFALLADGEVVAAAGTLPDACQLRDLAPMIEKKLEDQESFASDRLAEGLAGAPAVPACASGILATRIETSQPLLALWVRPEQIEEICWAGNPNVKDAATGTLKALTPRQSFATWRETVCGRSRPWMPHETKIIELFHVRAEFAIQRYRLKQLVKELEQANASLSALATTDALTGLPNRRLFDDRLKAAWQQALRDHSSIAVVAIDVDYFKKYNDRFGHPAGDECLKQVAGAIGEGCRQADVAARLGGEEFGMLLADTDVCGAAFMAERVRLAIERLQLDHPLNKGGVVTVSLGIAAGSPADWNDMSELLSAADEALYEAKAAGRNRISLAPSRKLNLRCIK